MFKRKRMYYREVARQYEATGEIAKALEASDTRLKEARSNRQLEKLLETEQKMRSKEENKRLDGIYAKL